MLFTLQPSVKNKVGISLDALSSRDHSNKAFSTCVSELFDAVCDVYRLFQLMFTK